MKMNDFWLVLFSSMLSFFFSGLLFRRLLKKRDEAYDSLELEYIKLKEIIAKLKKEKISDDLDRENEKFLDKKKQKDMFELMDLLHDLDEGPASNRKHKEEEVKNKLEDFE